ncbi:hypothetical protein GPY51_17820 [Photorhabdus laumondii subsp. laumondii]|uniref:Uncharacterized protein n=1 Tax=Photorhabdus laumondii subsp. laumondii TaxID=141679 RepID=A0A6L9JMV5_PHOLM|nr:MULTISPECIES: hypothetical protein [Photorhabdus]NDL19643.1 hypothetical protein [Photorhabdus laumondii subsp. laumondii]NDL40567.1 hypothetical protein [Photorhabdus laumondii subsp. laumondii]
MKSYLFKPEKNDSRKDMKNNKYILLTNTARNIVTARKKSEEIQIARILNRAVSPPITTKTNILAVNLKDTIKDVSISDLVIEYTSERSAISLTPVPKIDIISEDNSLFFSPYLIPFIYPSSFKLPLCWLHSLTPVT